MAIRQLRQRTRAGILLVGSVAVVLGVCTTPSNVLAHEGHAALPSKGLTVLGNQLLLSAGARQAIDLTTDKVTLADLDRTVECNARVELPWDQQAMVTTQVPGRVTNVLVRPGDAVSEGQVIARIESLELESLQLALLQADAELALARDRYQRRSSLAADGVIAGRQATDAETTWKQKSADCQIALCKLRAVGLTQQMLDEILASRRPLTSFSILSPITGIVAEADVRVGQQVKTTEHLFHIVDPSTVWIIGSVLEGDISDIRAGQQANVKFTSASDQTATGTVDHLRIKMDKQDRTRSAVMRVSNPNYALHHGMFGRMSIQVADSHEAVVCPSDAIISDSGDHYVLLNRGEGKYIRQPVHLGIRSHNQVEILDGLFPGDQVVTTGNHVLFSLFGNSSDGTNSPANEASKASPVPDELDHSSSEPSRQDNIIVAQGVVELPTDRKAFAGSRIEGRIRHIEVEHSQPVKAGQVLAQVDSLELRNVQGELLETETALAWTTDRIDMLSPLAQQNITSRNELWQLQTDERVLSAKRDSLIRTLSMIGVPDTEIEPLRNLDLSTENCNLVQSVPIRAAIDGTVANFDVVPGQVVDNQSSLFEIHDARRVWVKGYVFQHDATRVTVDQPVRVTFSSNPGVEVEGRVVRISPVLDSSERVLPLWVEVDNPDGRLIEGMWARLEIGVDQSPETPDDGPATPATRAYPISRGG